MISFERLGITPPRLIWAGCLVTLLYAAFSLGTYHPDEHFQILEYAHMKLFGTPTPDHLPWEYLLQMRPGIQPFVAWAVGKGLLAAGIYSPFAVVFVLQLLSGALSAAALLFFYRTVRDDLRDENARCWFLLLGFFLWYLAYLHVHFNAEMISGNLLLLLAALTMRCHRAVGRREFGRGVLLGMTAGLTFAVRFQMGFALLGYGIWLLVFHRRRKLYAGMVPGVLVVLVLGMLTDRWLYGEWTLTPVNYLRENILNENMLKFGTSPWWYYFTEPFTEGGYVYGPLALVAAVWFFWRRPRHVVTWMLVPFLLVHFFLGHKELRFFFPALFFAPWFIVLMFRELPRRWFGARVWRYVLGVLVAVNAGIMGYCLAQPRPEICFYKMMQEYCRGKKEVVALGLVPTGVGYGYIEDILEPGRIVEIRFYMPRNLRPLCFDTQEELEAAVPALQAPDRQLMVLSHCWWLDTELSLPLKKVPWRPYPDWLVRCFNFNDWTRFGARYMGVWKVEPTAAAAPEAV